MFGDLPWELIVRPVLEALVIIYYSIKLVKHRLPCFQYPHHNHYHRERRRQNQQPTSNVWRHIRMVVLLLYVLFWFSLNCRVAIALTRTVGEAPFQTGKVASFSCEDHQWAMFCPARNGTMAFGIIGAVLAAIEVYVCYRIEGLPRDESIELNDSMENVADDSLPAPSQQVQQHQQQQHHHQQHPQQQQYDQQSTKTS
ncbi:hypothetical protein BGZ73_004155 [Actinomortierella ambigua]|nr:hypothetical protein BGZ73_004155 [Actinomortierella ambigua]